ncbi:phosphoglucosamine mutase [Archaeoglobus profundus]|uniref:Phosphoglucosamine mutase n=1 Tax=Archaeoglobus profundus (strain DSM 5631 / JCM 9629 / NBRC 100127 / Av18) TaxID=572546 RepID=D2RGC3_ARCPA|nr:phosphoglucosamine mutase [Archaeoglobus profundus]ADB57348.1 Phosphoglucosamine mutase [Archaeoglobus profundus DSM 5631]
MTRIGAVGELFGTDGVRGVANEELTPEMAMNLGRVMGTLKRKVAVAMDTRISSYMLKSAVIAGLTSCGCDVVDLGIAPTPALQYYVKSKDEIEGGIVVTASHNPREYGGIKFIQEDGREFTRDMDAECERIYKSKSFRFASWDNIGQVYYDEYRRLYINGILSKVDVDAIAGKGFKVVIDCGNGAGYVTSPYILKELGCNVISINAHPDGRFPQRNPEPVEENVGLLKRVVKEVGADLGVAHDGDADRATFVDEKGRFIPEDIMLALMAKYYVEKNNGGKVVTPVSSSKCVEDVVVEAGGEVIYTPVGSPVVAETMLKVKAVFGGEGNGGLIFPEHLLARDGAMSFAKVLELMALENKPISELVKGIPKYYMIKTKLPCRDKIKLLKGLEEKFPDANFTDGARIDYEDSWILIRPSGTEPIVRIFAEAKSKKKAKELVEFGIKVVKEILGE